MEIISCGVQKVIPQVKSPQVLLDCDCGCVFTANLNTDSKRKKWFNKLNLFAWQVECPQCHNTIELAVKCRTKEKALAYFFCKNDDWIEAQK